MPSPHHRSEHRRIEATTSRHSTWRHSAPTSERILFSQLDPEKIVLHLLQHKVGREIVRTASGEQRMTMSDPRYTDLEPRRTTDPAGTIEHLMKSLVL